MSANLDKEILRRRTFAIISHPDAGKTTLTEKLLLYGGAIQMAGAVKAKQASRFAVSDFMEMEKERGISVSTSVMSFEYDGLALNLLDTPGHNDFSEDTYRTLTAADSVLMVIDSSKGVETQTKKLLEVCRLKRTPVITLMNKLDLEGMDPFDLIDNLEKELGMECIPMNWPIGKGADFTGVYDLAGKAIHFFEAADRGRANETEVIEDLNSPRLVEMIGNQKKVDQLIEDVELIEGVSSEFDEVKFRRGLITPVFFGSALNNFGVQTVLDAFCRLALPPQPRETLERVVEPEEEAFSGFVFKIQANMDKKHRDRIAFVRICSGVFKRGMQMKHVRIGKNVAVRNAMIFLAGNRSIVENAYPGDIIGIPNHGKIQIADTFTQGEDLQFSGIPNFAPELFRRAVLRDPLKSKALQKGLVQVCEEGAAQLFRPVNGSDYIVGTLGELQFQVIESRLKNEYQVDAIFEHIAKDVCRWVICDDQAVVRDLLRHYEADLFHDGNGKLCILSKNIFRVNRIQKQFETIKLATTME
jgi:peptide chain release factor 3